MAIIPRSHKYPEVIQEMEKIGYKILPKFISFLKENFKEIESKEFYYANINEKETKEWLSFDENSLYFYTEPYEEKYWAECHFSHCFFHFMKKH